MQAVDVLESFKAQAAGRTAPVLEVRGDVRVRLMTPSLERFVQEGGYHNVIRYLSDPSPYGLVLGNIAVNNVVLLQKPKTVRYGFFEVGLDLHIMNLIHRGEKPQTPIELIDDPKFRAACTLLNIHHIETNGSEFKFPHQKSTRKERALKIAS